MKLSTLGVIGCVGLAVAGLVCLFIGVNPNFLHPQAPPDDSAIEEVVAPSPPEDDEEQPEEEKKPEPEHRRVRGQSPSR
ncbi:hypothetical protein [Luteolibacter luteus]|uniref:Uncharacterized protein n=1 Tax=Luteolibacter luteus TaxID=2728835 RepID=A0A858RHS6_9BACT|nr:hypothetical protein [Luteolibacter luteus]QJE96265.1 hypothetical protein HHL09_10875 [Luteolibacter luteus]